MAGTTAFDESSSSKVELLTVNGSIASLKVAVTVAETGTPEAFAAGETEVTVGGVLSCTVTVPLPLLPQPVVPSVTVTVQVVVEAGDTVMEAVVAPPGLHE